MFFKLFKSKPNRFADSDFALFQDTKHQLEMLGISYDDLITETERLLSLQIPDTKLTEIKLINTPHWLLTVGNENKKGLAPVRRAACAMDFSSTVSASTLNKTSLNFILSFSFVDVGLPTVAHQFWIDINGTLDEFGDKGELLSRLYRFESKSNAC
jgi:hypothetical protein